MSTDTNTVKPSTSFTEDEQHVAGNAHNCFRAGQFDATLGILKKLQKSHSNDARLMHNRALTEFCKSGKTKVLDFKKSLVKIQKLLQQSNKEEEDIVLNTEKNNYISLYYNQALLFYNLHQYSETEVILGHLYENLDGSEETYLLKIGLLLIDTYLFTYNPEKAGNLISVLEKNFLTNEDATKRSGNNDEKAKSTPTLGMAEAESLKVHLRYLKTLCCLQTKSIKSSKREIKSLTNVYSNSGGGGQQTNIVQVASVFLKSNFECVRSNYHKAYKLLGASPPPVATNVANGALQEGISTMYYNNLAVLHFGMGKHNIGSFYMQKALQENDAAVSSATKQHHLNNSSGNSRHQQLSTAKPLCVLNLNRRFELAYNYGLQLLYSGNPAAAFDSLLLAVHAFHANPRLWLRLAECCIHKCTTCASEGKMKGGSHTKKSNSAFAMIGSGTNRKVVINTSLPPLGTKSNNLTTPLPTLEFASVCLNNALFLLKEAMNGISWDTVIDIKKNNGSKSDEDQAPELIIACLPGAPLSGNDIIHLYASVLANNAFVTLTLGNGLLALEYSQQLLSLPRLSGCNRYLGNMYAAEALVSLDRISEAIQHLSVEKISTVSLEIDNNGMKSPGSDDGSVKSGQNNKAHNHNHVSQKATEFVSPWHFPSNINCAHGYMILNLANAHCLRSEHEKAQRLLRQASSLVSARQAPPQALLLAVYLNLQGGGNGLVTALLMLRHNSLVVTPQQTSFAAKFPKLVNGNGARPPTGNNSSSFESGSSGGDTNSAAPVNQTRLKSSTPQPVAGGQTPERVVKAKNNEGKKRNRR
ncbi:CCR4-NOT transcription complex subunit 10-like isoform X2 [Clavelina lepadiformis]|uniref:CCR4-NOT transcription complex subunit 10-like isoform X2 n=1 Tax=Clavelina lepadiformis TaxID=159417 RepID=UPI004041B498